MGGRREGLKNWARKANFKVTQGMVSLTLTPKMRRGSSKAGDFLGRRMYRKRDPSRGGSAEPGGETTMRIEKGFSGEMTPQPKMLLLRKGQKGKLRREGIYPTRGRRKKREPRLHWLNLLRGEKRKCWFISGGGLT